MLHGLQGIALGLFGAIEVATDHGHDIRNAVKLRRSGRGYRRSFRPT